MSHIQPTEQGYGSHNPKPDPDPNILDLTLSLTLTLIIVLILTNSNFNPDPKRMTPPNLTLIVRILFCRVRVTFKLRV